MYYLLGTSCRPTPPIVIHALFNPASLFVYLSYTRHRQLNLWPSHSPVHLLSEEDGAGVSLLGSFAGELMSQEVLGLFLLEGEDLTT